MDYALAKRPLEQDIYCGDAGLFRHEGNHLFMAVIDALGHGEEAQQQADAGVAFLTENDRQPLVDMMQGLHRHLRGGRGMVASLCRLEIDSGRLACVSVGDTLVRKLNRDRQRICSRPGVIGYQIRSLREEYLQLEPGAVLLLHTDGIPANFREFDETLLREDAETIAGEIIGRYGKLHDDNLCMVLKC